MNKHTRTTHTYFGRKIERELTTIYSLLQNKKNPFVYIADTIYIYI